MVLISAKFELAKEALLYVGVLDEFYVDSEGQLGPFELRHSEAITLNIQYVRLSEGGATLDSHDYRGQASADRTCA